MKNVNINQEIVREMTHLLEKTAVESFAPVLVDGIVSDESRIEAILINLKSINAGYDKSDALTQIRALMDMYNIQVDELLELYKH
jgi:hypothetical protein